MRKAQAQVFKFLIIAIMLAVLIFFGYKSMKNISGKACTSDLAKFGADIRTLYVPYGSIETINLNAPCDTDTIFFVDLDKEIDFALLDQPIVQDSVEGNVKENVFLFSENELVGSFYMERMQVEDAGFLCFDTRRKKLNMEVDGSGMKIDHIDNRFNCGPIRIELTFDEETIPDEIFLSPGEEDDFMEDSPETMESIDLLRTMRVENGKTRIDVALRPRGGVTFGDISYIEWIDKDCIESLQEQGIEYNGPLPENTVDDPVIMWHFDTLEQYEEVSYTLDDPTIAERCRELIQAVASASRITTPTAAPTGGTPSDTTIPTPSPTPLDTTIPTPSPDLTGAPSPNI